SEPMTHKKNNNSTLEPNKNAPYNPKNQKPEKSNNTFGSTGYIFWFLRLFDIFNNVWCLTIFVAVGSLGCEGCGWMRILRSDVKHGTVVVLPEVLDDFLVLYNVIKKGDRVYADTSREVRFGDRYDRPEKGKRISVFLGISAESVTWDRYLNRLRVHGVICEAPEDVGAGSHHTLNVTLNKPLTIVKENWMKYELDQLKKATETGAPPVSVIVVDDEGYCLAVLRGFGFDVKAEETVSLPGKRSADERTKTLIELFKSAAKAIEGLDSEFRQSIVVLGVGFIKNEFVRFLENSKPELRKAIVDVKSVNNSGKAGIDEALRSGILNKALKNVRIAEEAEAVEKILERLGKDQATATYGLADVEKANSIGSVDQLLLTDRKLREASDEERRVLESLMREVENKRGKIVIISTEHEAGTKLDSLGGIAALLRFPIS
ncbi:mRNA surveillance protein pelota, partial [Candidatus Bathyarchaeota archaeon]|nr:mRNA surveillance protein pelota [Candidatus Bathyarchaeota archaeon]